MTLASTASETLPPIPPATNRPTVSWGAVFAGMVTAIALQIGLAQLCVSLGLAMYTPFDPNQPTTTIAMATIIAWVGCALVGLFLGGWVAGRLAHFQSHTIAGLHGALVWATGAVMASATVAVTVALLAGGTVKVAGDAMQAAATGAGAIGSSVASAVAPNWDAVRDQVKDASGKLADAAKNGNLETRFADQSRLMELLGKFFVADRAQRPTGPEKEELSGLVASQLGISKEAAIKTMDQWERSWDAAVAKFNQAQEAAKQKAAEAALAAKKYTASAAGISFGLMLVGLIAAIMGGMFGSVCFRHEEARSTLGTEYVTNRALPT
ncbi:MAG TPA: hypothetical protein VHX44_18625 [Planctomycetota bacterium]|nr:hypothetical protein [Planctomycetota bacterium]